MELLASLVLVAAGAAYVWNLTRRRNLRAGSKLAGRMRALDPERRRAVRSAIAEGRAVDDPQDADLAVSLIDYQEQARPGHGGPPELAVDTVILTAIAGAFWVLELPMPLWILLVAVALLAAVSAALEPLRRRSEREHRPRRLRAREANLRLLGGDEDT